MACGCQGGGGTGDQWVVVYPDMTQSQPMPKAKATAEVQTRGGYIKQA